WHWRPPRQRHTPTRLVLPRGGGWKREQMIAILTSRTCRDRHSIAYRKVGARRASYDILVQQHSFLSTVPVPNRTLLVTAPRHPCEPRRVLHAYLTPLSLLRLAQWTPERSRSRSASRSRGVGREVSVAWSVTGCRKAPYGTSTGLPRDLLGQ